MKKFMRFASLFLALVLVFSLAIPALAASAQGTYNYNSTSYTYDVSTSYTSTKGTAYIILHDNNTLLLSVYGRGEVKVGLTSYTSYGNASGYYSVWAYPGNKVTVDGVQQTGTVVGCTASFHILDTCVITL